MDDRNERATKDPDGKPHRCSCGAFAVLLSGEYHDCATERAVALQQRQVEALEKIALGTTGSLRVHIPKGFKLVKQSDHDLAVVPE